MGCGKPATLGYRFSLGWLIGLVAIGCIVDPATVHAADLQRCRQLLITGQYRECIGTAGTAIRDREYGESWPVLKAQAELVIGRYSEAKQTVDAGLKRYSWSVPLRLVGYRACLHCGETNRARELLKEIETLALRTPWRYTDMDDLLALGKAALLLGADARDVLEGFYDRAKRLYPSRREPDLAGGQLALDKHDLKLAADIYGDALKRFADDADVHFGLARAYAAGEPERSRIELEKTLALNPRHSQALLFRIDRLIDAERFEDAKGVLNQVLEINPQEPEAWAYRAVLAHLGNDPQGETAFRAKALASWRENPAVDHLVGRKLSENYRFAEGATYQKRSLRFDANYLPARVQLSQDLLRLGAEEEGWRLANAIHADDGYDVATFNLLELRDRIASFRTLSDAGFILRMDAREAKIYGDRVLRLLGRAKQVLCQKYGLELKHQITVEIFPEENDFAVRTFGMPAVSGYLGVCFGKVITANSPASQGEHPSNWEAVLWHEFCHVVTLELTHNKMPRWLSEGISVYEELQENPLWGQRMNPRYREMILADGLTPIGELSSAFLSPQSPLHLQFTYYESALVVEFLVQRYGLDALKRILHDLGAGLPINVVLARQTDPLPKLERDFDRFARERAANLAPDVDWAKPDLTALLNDDTDALDEWVQQHPQNVAGLRALARKHLQEEQWEQAKSPLVTLIDIYPGDVGAGNAYELLARVHQELQETAAERKVLEKYASLDAAAFHVGLRLLELDRREQDWKALQRNAERILAVNPLIRQPHQTLAESCEHLGDTKRAVSAYRTLLVLEPDDPAEIHYRLARLLHQQSDPSAKRHVLAALEEAPRFRMAHRLLLEISRQTR